MSWSLSISKCPRKNFEAAVDAAIATGQDAAVIGEDVARAKSALKLLAANVARPYISASAGGHCVEHGQIEITSENSWHDGTQVSVSGSF